MSIHEYAPEGKTYALGIDHLIQNRESVVEMIDRMSEEELQLVSRLERVVATKMYFIQEHARLEYKIKDLKGGD